jgi:hypothetical protein
VNLIEKLGGYEKAKAELKDKQWRKDNLHGSKEFTWHMVQHIRLLEVALLAYRRKHGIFEVGDKVFYIGRANDNDLYTLKETYDGHNFVVGSNGTDKDFWTLFIEEICHATDEEIKAGHRL